MNVGVAVAVDDGLIVPVVRDVDLLSIAGLNRAIADVAARARSGKLRLDDFGGGTFTVDNTGWLGSNLTMPIINVPEVGILTMEAITKRAVVVETPSGDFDRHPADDEHGPRRSTTGRTTAPGGRPSCAPSRTGSRPSAPRPRSSRPAAPARHERCASSSPAGRGSSARRLVRALRGRGDEVVAAVRDPDRARGLRDLGCRLVRSRPVARPPS